MWDGAAIPSDSTIYLQQSFGSMPLQLRACHRTILIHPKPQQFCLKPLHLGIQDCVRSGCSRPLEPLLLNNFNTKIPQLVFPSLKIFPRSMLNLAIPLHCQSTNVRSGGFCGDRSCRFSLYWDISIQLHLVVLLFSQPTHARDRTCVEIVHSSTLLLPPCLPHQGTVSRLT